MRPLLNIALEVFDGLMLAYLLVLDLIYGVLAAIGWRTVNGFVRRRALRDYEAVAQSPLSLPISILAPAYNEEPTIVASITALLACRYQEFEVIVINDDSSMPLIRWSARSTRIRCSIPALSPAWRGSSRLRRIRLQSAESYASSTAHGSRAEKSWVDAGGYDPNTVGEDAELVLRLYRTRADQGKPCRVTFFPDPICWTEAPSTLRVLTRQRVRWQRGLIEMLRKHRGMIGRRRYGAVGLFALPYFTVFEAFGPLLEVVGYAAFALTLALGIGTPIYAAMFLGLSLSYGLILSFATVLMEERAFQRYPGWRDLFQLSAMAIIENLGYRQYLSLIGVRGW
ncbi:MAG: glycosyltransferase [Solirubrobacteraceae bacterium]